MQSSEAEIITFPIYARKLTCAPTVRSFVAEQIDMFKDLIHDVFDAEHALRDAESRYLPVPKWMRHAPSDAAFHVLFALIDLSNSDQTYGPYAFYSTLRIKPTERALIMRSAFSAIRQNCATRAHIPTCLGSMLRRIGLEPELDQGERKLIKQFILAAELTSPERCIESLRRLHCANVRFLQPGPSLRR